MSQTDRCCDDGIQKCPKCGALLAPGPGYGYVEWRCGSYSTPDICVNFYESMRCKLNQSKAENKRLRQLVMHVRAEHWEELRAVAHSQGAVDWGAAPLIDAAQKWVVATSHLLEDWKPEVVESKGPA